MPPDVEDAAVPLLASLWAGLGGAADALDHVQVTGPVGALPSVFDVTGFATATVAAAALAVAELGAARADAAVAAVSVDRAAASASFRFEALVRPIGWELPPIWDPVAGDYQTADGWIRLHTNYESHRLAALEVLGAAAEREAVAGAVARWGGDDLEAAVLAAGGCAAVMRTERDWRSHPAGRATAEEPPVRIDRAPGRVAAGSATASIGPARAGLPLAGVRVLDLTRVIAGPEATRYLAAHGADEQRIDPPGFEEVPALLPEVTAGKRCAALDLGSADGRSRFLELVARAHVLFDGLRPGALARMGLDRAELRAANPALVVVDHDAYGWSGPWAPRRGFDSLVQMSTGIAAAGAEAAAVDRPTPLPAQALDHGTGHLLAAAACRALTIGLGAGGALDVKGSLVGASNLLRSLPGVEAPPDVDELLRTVPLERASSTWGDLERVPLAGRIDGAPARWALDAGPLGRDPARFS